MPKTTPAELAQRLHSLRPDADHQAEWPVHRRALTFQSILNRAAKERPAAPRRIGSRALVAGGLAVALLGGGTAWAASNYATWYGGGANDGLTCMTDWHDPSSGEEANQYGGATLSTDPIADCNEYAELTSKPQIEDPIAVRFHGLLVVGPKAGRPADAVPLEKPTPSADPSSSSQAPTDQPHRDPDQEFELDNTLADAVDGGASKCWNTKTGTAFVKAELDRLGLDGWRVTTSDSQKPSSGPSQPSSKTSLPMPTPAGGDCADFFISSPGVVTVKPLGTAAHQTELSRALRKQISQRCVSLEQAKQLTTKLLAKAGPHWPISTTTDATAKCTRVDLVYDGSTQVFLYGPATK